MTVTPASYTLETLGFDPSWQSSAIRAAFTLDGTLEDFTLARVSAVDPAREATIRDRRPVVEEAFLKAAAREADGQFGLVQPLRIHVLEPAAA